MSRQVGPEEDFNWSYPGSNSNVPTIMVLRPTWDEFKDFNQYMKKVEAMGAQKGGIVKIIPPKEWVPRKEKFDIDKCDIMIPDPIEQFVSGNKGIYNCMNIKKKSVTVKEYYHKATSTKYKRSLVTNFEELERKYWNNITYNAPIYGADVQGSVMDKDSKVWNIQKLGSILDWVNHDYNVKIDGVNTAYLYFGMWKSAFAWHTEDMDLHSINYLHYGESKFWYSIPPEYARRFERMALGLFPQFAKECSSYLRHKMCMISPNVLRQNSIPYNKIAQKEGEIMITFPLGYHSGFNTGFNVAESTNFATERWVEYGKRATRCHCRPDTVNISMDCFVKRLQPERYDDWLNGKDYGRHPEEPNATLSAASPPTAEEFMVNNRNKDKAIPLCLLEPKSGKKRRHPIHKDKNPAFLSKLITRIKLFGTNLLQISQNRKRGAPRGRMSMYVAGEAEESDCLDMDEEEPINKLARKQYNASTTSDAVDHNNSGATISRPKCNKKISHTPELWNSLDTIIKGNNAAEENGNIGNGMKVKWESASFTAKPKQNIMNITTDDNNETPSNLVDTISRLQRSLSKNTLPTVQFHSSLTPPNNINAVNNLSQNPLQNGSKNAATSNPNNIQLNWLQATPRMPGNSMHHKEFENSMQALQPQYQLNGNSRIPLAHQQLTPPAVCNPSLSTSNSLMQSTIPSSTVFPSLTSPFQNNTSTIKEFLGRLNPVETTNLTDMPNGTGGSRLETYTNNSQVQPSRTNGCKSSSPYTTSYKLSPGTQYSQYVNQTIPPIIPSIRNPPLHFTATTQNLSLLRNLGPQQKTLSNYSNSSNTSTHAATVLLTPRYSNEVARSDWARSNQLILTSKDRRQIKTSVTILERQKDGSPWQPPLKLPVGNAWGWQVNGFVNMFESAIYINLHGPRNMARSFMLPFRNILATTKKSQVAINAKQDIWPPSDDMLGLCEDVSRWELHMCINPNTDIKATIIDPWKKTYLLTIPGKLLA